MAYILYDPFEFPNILPEINLSSADIKNQVEKLDYKLDSSKNGPAEGKYPITMVPVFYRFVMREQRIPTQDEFQKEARREMLINGFDLDGQEEDYKNGLVARLTSRTYPSLIRDVHFCKLLEDKLSDKFDVIYNPVLDLSGIDILLIPKCQELGSWSYGICLFIDTEDGRKGLGRKKNYRKKFYYVKYIELPKTRPTNVSGIWLYDDSDVTNLQRLISNAH